MSYIPLKRRWPSSRENISCFSCSVAACLAHWDLWKQRIALPSRTAFSGQWEKLVEYRVGRGDSARSLPETDITVQRAKIVLEEMEKGWLLLGNSCWSVNCHPAKSWIKPDSKDIMDRGEIFFPCLIYSYSLLVLPLMVAEAGRGLLLESLMHVHSG